MAAKTNCNRSVHCTSIEIEQLEFSVILLILGVVVEQIGQLIREIIIREIIMSKIGQIIMKQCIILPQP
jgi:hypothetical protein